MGAFTALLASEITIVEQFSTFWLVDAADLKKSYITPALKG